MNCILSHYNKDSIDSLINQRYKDWTAIVFGEEKIDDTRIHTFYPRNELIASRFNDGLKKVNGLVTYMCPGDIWYENAFETFVNNFRGKAICVGNYLCHDVSLVDEIGYWSEFPINESCADTIFMNKIKEITYIDIKIGRRRRERSLYN